MTQERKVEESEKEADKQMEQILAQNGTNPKSVENTKERQVEPDRTDLLQTPKKQVQIEEEKKEETKLEKILQKEDTASFDSKAEIVAENKYPSLPPM